MPLLLLHAGDDPICSVDGLTERLDVVRDNPCLMAVITPAGGHVAWASASGAAQLGHLADIPLHSPALSALAFQPSESAALFPSDANGVLRALLPSPVFEWSWDNAAAVQYVRTVFAHAAAYEWTGAMAMAAEPQSVC